MNSEIAKVDIGTMDKVSNSIFDYLKTKNVEILDAIIDSITNRPSVFQRFFPTEYDNALQEINVKKLQEGFERESKLISAYEEIRLTIIKDRASDLCALLSAKGKEELSREVMKSIDSITQTIKDSQNKMLKSSMEEEIMINKDYASNERIRKIAIDQMNDRLNTHIVASKTLLDKTVALLNSYAERN